MKRQQGGDRETNGGGIRQSEGTEDAQKQSREKNRQTERTVAIAKDRAWKNWSESLQSNEGRAKMFKIYLAKQMRK